MLSTSLTVLVASRCLVYVGCSPEKHVESIPLTEGGGNLVHWGRTLMPDFYAPNDPRDDQHTTAKGDPIQGGEPGPSAQRLPQHGFADLVREPRAERERGALHRGHEVVGGGP